MDEKLNNALLNKFMQIINLHVVGMFAITGIYSNHELFILRL